MEETKREQRHWTRREVVNGKEKSYELIGTPNMYLRDGGIFESIIGKDIDRHYDIIKVTVTVETKSMGKESTVLKPSA